MVKRVVKSDNNKFAPSLLGVNISVDPLVVQEPSLDPLLVIVILLLFVLFKAILPALGLGIISLEARTCSE